MLVVRFVPDNCLISDPARFARKALLCGAPGQGQSRSPKALNSRTRWMDGVQGWVKMREDKEGSKPGGQEAMNGASGNGWMDGWTD